MESVERVSASLAAGSVGSLATSDELQSLLVALFAIAVREVIYWWRNRRRTPADVVELPPGSGGA